MILVQHEDETRGKQKGECGLDPLYKVEKSLLLNKKTKKSIGLKIKSVAEAIAKIEHESGLTYPPYFVEPVLPVVSSSENVIEGLGVLYARTIPIQVQGKVQIIVELSAPLVLYATKVTLRVVVAHELLHYVELVRNFSTMNVASQITSSSIFEERFTDSSRALDPSLVFKDKKFAKGLAKKISTGLDDPKLNEKCRLKWIEKSMPIARIAMGSNQVNIPAESIITTEFDPKVRQILLAIDSAK